MTTENKTSTSRSVTQVITTAALLEGGGFPVRRPFPVNGGLSQFDPFLLLDHMGPVDWAPNEAIGAPDHPHRGFETVTYLLEGRMQHKDSHGHMGNLEPGDAQWMTAGSGVVHSEMPHPDFFKTGGVLNGFQLWVNLPASDKMIPPHYQEIPAARIPQAQSRDGQVKVRIIAGESLGISAVIATRIPITYLHITLQPGAVFEQTLTPGHNAFAYVFLGQAHIGEQQTPVKEGQAALLGDGDQVRLAVDKDYGTAVELLLLAGPPLGEPIARHGPFVMNTQEEIAQAFRDYRDGKMGEIPATISQKGDRHG